MTIDQTQLATIIMAVAALLGVVGTNVVNIIVALRTGKKVDEATSAATKTAAKADAIHDLVDGNASKAAEQVRVLQARLESLHTQLMDVMEKRVDDAKAAPPTNPPRPLPVVFVDQRAPETKP